MWARKFNVKYVPLFEMINALKRTVSHSLGEYDIVDMLIDFNKFIDYVKNLDLVALQGIIPGHIQLVRHSNNTKAGIYSWYPYQKAIFTIRDTERTQNTYCAEVKLTIPEYLSSYLSDLPYFDNVSSTLHFYDGDIFLRFHF